VAVNFDAVLRLAAKVTGLQDIEKLKGTLGAVEGTARKARTAFTNVTSSATWQAAAIGAAAIGTGLVLSVRTAMEFEKAMSGVTAKVGGTSEEMAELNKLARDLGRSTQFSAKQAAEGMDFLAMAGFKSNEIIAAMPGLLNLAAAGNLELGVAADIASNILGGMNLKAEETARVADVLAKAATSSNVSVEMLGETFKFVAPVAAKAGVSLEEVAAAAGLLGDAGIQGSEAGTGLRSVLLRLAAPPTEAAGALNRLSVSTKDAAGNMRPLGDILRDVDKRFKELNLGTADQLQIQNALFGKTAIATGAILQQAAANGTLDEKTKLLMNSQGAAAKMAETMNDNLAGAFTRLTSAIEGFQIQLVSGSSPALKGLVDGLAGAINVVTDLMERFPLLTTAVLALSAAFIALVALAPFIAAFISVIGSIKAALVGVGFATIMAGWQTVAIVAFTAIKGVLIGFAGWLVSTALPAILAVFSGPVGWTVLAVAAVVAMAIAFREPLMKFFAWVGKGFADMWNATMRLAYSVFVQPLANIWNNVLKGPVTGYFNWMRSAFTTAWTALIAISYQLFIAPWVNLFMAARKVVGDLWGWVKGAFQSAWPAIMDFTDKLFVKPWVKLWNNVLREPVTKAWEWLKTTWGQIAGFFTKYVTRPIGDAWQFTTTAVQTAWRTVSEFIPKAMQAAGDRVRSIFRGIAVFIANGINSIIRSINNLIQRFNNVAAATKSPFRISPLNTISVPAFAQGGTVNRPTLLMAGEGGEREYIVPESKMAAASSRFLGGARGASVIPSSSSSGAANSISPVQITIKTGPVMQDQQGQRWMTIEDGERMARQTAEQVLRISRTSGGRRAQGVR
jgi:TP901 family phage tail tape measure protein